MNSLGRSRKREKSFARPRRDPMGQGQGHPGEEPAQILYTIKKGQSAGVSGIEAEGVCRKCRGAHCAPLWGMDVTGIMRQPLNQTYSACHPLIFTFYK
ncbi:MAG: hypothetical protein ACYC6H_12435 [Bellilinea sp.]